MKLIAAFLLVMVSLVTTAQDASKLTLPGSPAFSILDYEPTSVMRPTNVKALAGDVLNSFDKDGKLKMNLGLEFSPYWLGSHPRLTREAYLHPDFGHTILQSLSISAATVKDSVTGNSKLGAGIRFKLMNGEPVDELATKSTELRQSTQIVSIISATRALVSAGAVASRSAATSIIRTNLERAGVSSSVISEITGYADGISPRYTDDANSLTAFIEAISQKKIDDYADLAAEVSNLIYQRKGFILEIAGAGGFGTTTQKDPDKYGVWATASYGVSDNDQFSATLRYMHQHSKVTDTTSRNTDIGISWLKKTSALNISLEGMLRWYNADVPDKDISNNPIIRTQKDFTYRVAVQGSYLITRDISINLSLGKDFNSPSITGNAFFSVLGINYSIFSREPMKLQ